MIKYTQYRRDLLRLGAEEKAHLVAIDHWMPRSGDQGRPLSMISGKFVYCLGERLKRYHCHVGRHLD